jgi:hypothetical protein
MSGSCTAADGTIANETTSSGTASTGTASNGNGTAANESTAPKGETASTTKANITSLAHLHAAGQGYGICRPENRRRAISQPSADYRDGTFDEKVGTGENEEG